LDQTANTKLPQRYIIRETTTAPMMFSSSPVRAICAMVILPVLKTMALGGVATGSIIIAVAVFEIHIERKAEASMNPRRMRGGLTPVRREYPRTFLYPYRFRIRKSGSDPKTITAAHWPDWPAQSVPLFRGVYVRRWDGA